MAEHMNFTNNRLDEHMLFVCPECGKEHASQHNWRKHLNEVHDYLNKTAADLNFTEINERYHECQVCHKWVANANQAIALLQYHRFMHLPFNCTYRCRHCKGAFSRKRALCEHLYRFHSRQIIKVEKLKRADDIPVALKNPEFYLRFQCPQCGETFDRFMQWLQHLDGAHYSTSVDLKMHRIAGTKNHYCLQCKKVVYTSAKEGLQRHHFMHLPFRMYFKCAFCKVQKSYKSEVLRHFIYAHPKDFAAFKKYVRKPVEWGAKINERLNFELEMILKSDKSRFGVNQNAKSHSGGKSQVPQMEQSKQKTDLIQKALMKSSIDLEKEPVGSSTKTGHPSQIRKFFDAFPEEENKKVKFAKPTNISKIAPMVNLQEVYDFDELCAEIFEEIDEPHPHQPTNNSAVTPTAQAHPDGVKSKDELQGQQKEEIISIQIDAVDECESAGGERFFLSPKRRRLRLDEPTINKEKSELLKSIFEMHINYLCPECGCEFQQQIPWREHVFNQHDLDNVIERNFRLLKNKSAYQCFECSEVLQTTKQSELQRHRFMHMPFQAYLKCTVCEKTKSSKPKIVNHLQQCHASLMEQKLNMRLLEKAKSKMFTCKDCKKEFKTYHRWQRHRTECRQHSTGAGRFYNIAENMKLLVHLRKAHARMQSMIAGERA